ncbi:MAG: hypothetical protein ACI9TY_001113 [Alphaproteobacteria bacterium]|jgi:hypothetical protein
MLLEIESFIQSIYYNPTFTDGAIFFPCFLLVLFLGALLGNKLKGVGVFLAALPMLIVGLYVDNFAVGYRLSDIEFVMSALALLIVGSMALYYAVLCEKNKASGDDESQ